MADKSGPYKSRHGVSRNTMVLRKARDDDARRVTEHEDGETYDSHAELSTRLTARGAVTGDLDTGKSSRRITSPSGRHVVVRQEGAVSGRLTTRIRIDDSTSLKTAGGDTIIKYKSGDVVIRRGARRAALRRQIIWVYALGYLLLFGLYAYFLITGVTTITPHAFLDHAFGGRKGDGIVELEQAAYRAMRGNRTPAELRVAESLSFYDENKDPVHVPSGNRLTLLTAAKLGQAIIADEKRPEALKTFDKPIRIYKETYLAQLNWPWLLTLYNSIGFFLLLAIFLWRPLMYYLGTQAKKTAVALRNARDAQQEAANYREKYRGLDYEVDTRAAELRSETEERNETDRQEALDQAHRQAEEITRGVKDALANEVGQIAGRMGADAATRACDQAREMLAASLGPKDHDAAIDELIADIAAMKG